MDYENKYKEALERAKKIHSETSFDYDRCIVEKVFPELKESEDEKVRRELLAFLKENLEKGGNAEETWDSEGLERWITWLEKQRQTKRFRYIVEFDNCDHCPFNKFVDDDYSPTHKECERTGELMMKWTNEGETDYRNPHTGVLDKCPFLQNNTITENYE